MTKLFIVLQVIFDVVLFFLIFFLLSRNRVDKSDVDKVLKTEERIKAFVEEKLKEISVVQEMLEYEKEKAIKELKRLELEVEKKLKLLGDAVNRKEEERRKKREIVRLLLDKGKSPAEIAAELNIPVSEVKLIATLNQKA